MTDRLGIALGVDTSGLKQGTKELDKFAKEGEKAAVEIDSLTDSIDELDKTLKPVAKDTLPTANDKLKKTDRESRGASKAVEALGNEVKQMAFGIKAGTLMLDNLATKATQSGATIHGFSGKVGMLTNKTLPAIGRQFNPMTVSIRKFTEGLRPAKNATQLLAFQAQDLAVQLSMGTSALVSFGQQAPQAFSAFGPSGAILGAIAGVGFALAGPLITAFTDSTEAADKFQSKIDDVRGSLKSTRIEINTGAIGLLEQQIRDATTEIEKLQNVPDKIGGRALVGLARQNKIQQNQVKILELEKDRTKNAEALAEFYKQQQELIQEGAATGEKGANIGQTAVSQGFESFTLDDFFREQEEAAEKEIALTKWKNEKKRQSDEKLAEDKKRMQDLELSTTANLFGNLAEIAAAGGEESFTMYKRMAQAQAGVSAGLAILNALAAPTGNPILNGAMAVSIGVLAGVQIAQIEQQTYSGARAMGGSVAGGNSYLVGEMGPEIITMGAQGGFVTPNHKMGGGENITVVNQIGNNVQGNVRAEIAAAMPAIVRATAQATRGRR